MSDTIRYSDADLQEFKVVVETKLQKTKSELEQLTAQLEELNEHMDERSDWLDDSYNQSESEMLVNMINRQKKHANDLESALVRIKNKTYGICEITGELIDKRRLMAVPTTSKSLAAKNAIRDQETRGKTPFKATPKPGKTNQIISKTISSQKSSKSSQKVVDDFLGDDLMDEEDDTLLNNVEDIDGIDLDEELDD